MTDRFFAPFVKLIQIDSVIAVAIQETIYFYIKHFECKFPTD